MTSSTKILLCALATVLLLPACKKKEAAKETAAHYFSGTASGSGTIMYDSIWAGENKGTPPYLEVRTLPSTEPRIKFWIESYTSTTGVYILDGVNAGASYSATVAGVSDSASVSGTLTLTAVSPDITGSINFTTAAGTVVSGSFNVAEPE